MKSNGKNTNSVYQCLIKQLLQQSRLLSIQESCLLWAFKGKTNLDAKQIEQLQAIATRVNKVTAIKSVQLNQSGGESHE